MYGAPSVVMALMYMTGASAWAQAVPQAYDQLQRSCLYITGHLTSHAAPVTKHLENLYKP